MNDRQHQLNLLHSEQHQLNSYCSKTLSLPLSRALAPPAQSRANSHGEFALDDVVSQQRTRGRPDWKELRGPQRPALFGEVFRSGCLDDLDRFRIWGSRFISLLISRVFTPPLGLLSILFLTLRSQMYKVVYVLLNFVFVYLYESSSG